MIWKWLGALYYELHMDHRKTKVVHHNRLKPYHGFKRPPGYYYALAEGRRDGPQSLVLVPSQGQRLTFVLQVVWSQGRGTTLCCQRCCVQRWQEGLPPVVGPGVQRQDGCTHPCLKMLQLQVCYPCLLFSTGCSSV